MPHALANGINIHYQRAGKGLDVVMIHGLSTNISFWYLTGIFPMLTRDFRVIAYDLRGHGYSDMPPHGYSSADMVADLDALLDHLGLEQVHVVGHSYGGAVAFHYAVLHPERTASLTLADATLQALQPLHEMDEIAQWLFRLDELGEFSSRRTTQDFRSMWAPIPLFRDRTNKLRQWQQLMHTTTARKDIRSMAGPTLEQMRQVNQPTMAVVGERSRWLKSSRELQKILSNYRRTVVPGAGHNVPIARPQIFVRILREFITSVNY